MGQYFNIVLRNAKTGEEKTIEHWTPRCGRDALDSVVERAWAELIETFTGEGDGKYWFLLSITDVTRR